MPGFPPFKGNFPAKFIHDLLNLGLNDFLGNPS